MPCPEVINGRSKVKDAPECTVCGGINRKIVNTEAGLKKESHRMMEKGFKKEGTLVCKSIPVP